MLSRLLLFLTRRELLWRLLPKSSKGMIYHRMFVTNTHTHSLSLYIYMYMLLVYYSIVNSEACENRTNYQTKSSIGNLCNRCMFKMIEHVSATPKTNPTSPNLAATSKNVIKPYLMQLALPLLPLLDGGLLHSFLWGFCICNKQRVIGKPNTSNITHKDIACTYDSSVPALPFQSARIDFPPGHHEHTSSHSPPLLSSAFPSPDSLRSPTTACSPFRGCSPCTRPSPRTRKNRRIPASRAHPRPAPPPSGHQKCGIPPTWPPLTRTNGQPFCPSSLAAVFISSTFPRTVRPNNIEVY